jgi:hypothetical protein
MSICVVSTCNYHVSVAGNYFANVWSNCLAVNVKYMRDLLSLGVVRFLICVRVVGHGLG